MQYTLLSSFSLSDCQLADGVHFFNLRCLRQSCANWQANRPGLSDRKICGCQRHGLLYCLCCTLDAPAQAIMLHEAVSKASFVGWRFQLNCHWGISYRNYCWICRTSQRSNLRTCLIGHDVALRAYLQCTARLSALKNRPSISLAISNCLHNAGAC